MLDVRALLLGAMALLIATYGITTTSGNSPKPSPEFTGSIAAVPAAAQTRQGQGLIWANPTK